MSDMRQDQDERSEGTPPLVVFAPLTEPIGARVPLICQAAEERFANFDTPKATVAGPITTLDFGTDGCVEVVDVAKPIPKELQSDRVPVDEASNHVMLIAKPGGNEVMDRAVSGVLLMVLGWAIATTATTKALYWAPSDQWLTAGEWLPYAEAAGDKFQLPRPVWLKVEARPQAPIQSLGLRSLVGYELSWSVPATKARINSFASVLDYVLDPVTPVPQAGQTFGDSDKPEFRFEAAGSAVRPILTITETNHGLVH